MPRINPTLPSMNGPQLITKRLSYQGNKKQTLKLMRKAAADEAAVREDTEKGSEEAWVALLFPVTRELTEKSVGAAWLVAVGAGLPA